MVNFSKLISTGIPALILLYVFYHIAFNVPVIYTIDIGAEGDVDAGKDAYLRNMTSQARLTQSMSIEGETFRNMTGSPLYFYITPGKSISNNTKITVELKFKGDSDLDISVYKDFAWKPLYIKNLDNYVLAKRFDDAAIFSRENKSNYTDFQNTREWISGNIPKYSQITLYDISPGEFVNRELTYQNDDLEINQTFRGTHSFLVYLKDNLNLTLGKQDLNAYNGTDVYSIELYDINGNLLFNDTIPDDDIVDNSTQKTRQSKSFFYGGINEGLYELRIVNLKGGNKEADSTITDIRINTDKLVTQGNIFLLEPGTLYFELKRNKTIRINAKQAQNISISGAVNKDIAIKRLNKWVSVELAEGNYTVSIDGDVYISGANFAFSNGSLFQPFDYEIISESSDWVIISNYQVEKDNEGWILAKKSFRGSDLELYKDKMIIFGLKKKTGGVVMLDEFKVPLTPE